MTCSYTPGKEKKNIVKSRAAELLKYLDDFNSTLFPYNTLGD